MKNLKIFPFLLFLIFTACNSGDKYIIKGDLSHLEGQKIYAVHEQYKKDIVVDTVKVEKGKFELSGESEMLSALQLYTENNTPLLRFFVKNGDRISLKGDARKPFEIRIEGNEAYETISDFNKRNSALLQRITDKQKEYTTHGKDSSYFSDLEKLSEIIRKDACQEIAAHPASPASIILMYEYLLSDKTVEQCDSLLRIMPPEAKPVSLLAKIDLFIEQVRKTATGKAFPYSALKSDKDSTVSTNTFRDIPTLITWWAAYDPESVREMKNLKEIYSRYKGKKLRMVNISLDPDNERWKKQIKTDTLKWMQLVQEEGWNAVPVRNLGISNIPYTIILDRSGRIEKTGLNGIELRKYIDEMVTREDTISSPRNKP